LLTAIIYLSPIRGFMGILVLPTVSQALFDLRKRSATVVILYLFAVDVFQWASPFRLEQILQAAGNYAAGFAFTIIFTLITKQAVEARRREQALRQEVEAANQQLREAARQSQELATTLERNRVAREIHDGVGHYLTVVKTQLDGAAALIATEPDRARDAVVKAAKLTAEALDDVRRSVGNLRADTARAPLSAAITKLTEEAGFPISVRIEGTARTLSPGIEHALFRSVQEGLTNVRKHAAASRAEVALDFRAMGRVLLAISDNGNGARSSASGGFGLLGIRERIEVLGGSVEAGNQPEGGFRLKVEVPA
jgi:signal transduction histidine kinase